MKHLTKIGSRFVDLSAITRIQQDGESLTVFFRDGQAPWGFTGKEAHALGAAVLDAMAGGRER